MQELQEAVSTAKEFVETLIPEADSPQLEEIERDGDAWIVTLSFARSYKGDSGLGALKAFNAYENRTYKQIRVENGAVESMKIREPAGG